MPAAICLPVRFNLIKQICCIAVWMYASDGSWDSAQYTKEVRGQSKGAPRLNGNLYRKVNFGYTNVAILFLSQRRDTKSPCSWKIVGRTSHLGNPLEVVAGDSWVEKILVCARFTLIISLRCTEYSAERLQSVSLHILEQQRDQTTIAKL